MKNVNKTQGVTLLEVMLVLAIAAMIIVMSVRYYQSATQSQQANAVLQMIQAVTANADGLALGANSYAGVSTATIQSMLPNNSNVTPWGGTLTIGTGTATTYPVSISSTPVVVCQKLVSALTANPKFTSLTTCGAAGSAAATFSYTYDSTK
jgi:prepilin-type N-terminal cleavage/methylation domain-containing protein